MRVVTVDEAGATVTTLDSFVNDAAREAPAKHGAQSELPGVGSVVAGRYQLERLLGQGGMGAVFAASHVVTGRRVALKLLREDPARNRAAALRMAREARAVGRIQHRNVVAVYDAGFAAGRPFIAMELLDGQSLEQRIESTGPMPEPQAIDTLRQIARGVEAAHANGIIHRDLKPANILLCPAPGAARELVKVVDFGISKLLGDTDDVLVTSHGEQLGTPAFMSPEQVRGDALDERTDVYALAVILYYTLTKRFPFHARSRAELFAKILTARPEPLTGVSTATAKVVLKGLARERTERYPSAGAFAAALCQRHTRSKTLRSRLVYLTAAVSGIALTTIPTRLMHAAPSEPAALVQPQSAETPAPVAEPLPPDDPQPSAAVARAAPELERAAPARPRARPRASVDHPTTSVRDDTVVDEVKLMSW